MKESQRLDFIEEGNEVELSAQDLFALSPPAIPDDAQDRTERAVRAVDVTAAPHASGEPHVADEPVRAPPQSATAQRASAARRLSGRHILFVLGVAAVAAAAVTLIGTTDTPPIDAPTQPSMPPATEEPAAEAAGPAEVEGPPVLFKNPFDDSEVFEFPPGTSREEARAAVADLLIMRARERLEHEAFAKQR